jgi:hypothetical protein
MVKNITLAAGFMILTSSFTQVQAQNSEDWLKLGLQIVNEIDKQNQKNNNRPMGTSSQYITRNGRKYWKVQGWNNVWQDAWGNEIVVNVDGSSGRHSSQHGIKWHKYDGKYWTSSSSIDHMPYRYIINGKHYAMTQDHFIAYFQQSPPAMVGNGFYPVDRPGVTTVNKFGHAYQPPQPKDEGVSKEELIELIKLMKQDEKDDDRLTKEEVARMIDERERQKEREQQEKKKDLLILELTERLEAMQEKLEKLENNRD